MEQNELTENKQKKLDFLLADLKANKAEIARRSNLQRFIIGLYIGFIVVVGKEVASKQLTAPLTAPLIIGLWTSAALSLLFYKREGLEIKRLGLIIRNRIKKYTNKILENENNEIDLIPSETKSGHFEEQDIRNTTRILDQIFNWSIFFILPLITTIFYIDPNQLKSLLIFSNITAIQVILMIYFLLALSSIILLLCEFKFPKEKDKLGGTKKAVYDDPHI